MKVRQEKAFAPVTITLETQVEVDALFGIFNYSLITRIAERNGIDLYIALRPFRTDAYIKVWDEVYAAFNKR